MTALLAIAMMAPQFQPMEVTSSAGALKVERLVALEFPWGMANLPDGRLLITEKPGRLRIWSTAGLSEPVSGVPKVSYHDQGGLLDVERDPKFASNGLVYLYFVEAAEVQTLVADVWDPRFGPKPKEINSTMKGGAIARGKLVGNRLENVKIIWRQTPKTIGRGHFGGRLVFDNAGHLFVTSGERMRFDVAQESGQSRQDCSH